MLVAPSWLHLLSQLSQFPLMHGLCVQATVYPWLFFGFKSLFTHTSYINRSTETSHACNTTSCLPQPLPSPYTKGVHSFGVVNTCIFGSVNTCTATRQGGAGNEEIPGTQRCNQTSGQQHLIIQEHLKYKGFERSNFSAVPLKLVINEAVISQKDPSREKKEVLTRIMNEQKRDFATEGKENVLFPGNCLVKDVAVQRQSNRTPKRRNVVLCWEMHVFIMCISICMFTCSRKISTTVLIVKNLI